MTEDFLGQFMDNGSRARLLRVFIFDQERPFSIKDAAKRAGLSALVAGRELKVLEKWGVVKKAKSLSITLGNGTARKVQAKTKEDVWDFNPNFIHSRALSAFVHDIAPMRYESVVTALKGCGKLGTLVLSGSFTGDVTRPLDILIAGENLSENRLELALKTLESAFGRELRYAAFTTPELRYRLTVQDRLVRDTLDFPHLVLLDRSNIL
jgi:hypothetical protein